MFKHVSKKKQQQSKPGSIREQTPQQRNNENISIQKKNVEKKKTRENFSAFKGSKINATKWFCTPQK